MTSPHNPEPTPTDRRQAQTRREDQAARVAEIEGRVSPHNPAEEAGDAPAPWQVAYRAWGDPVSAAGVEMIGKPVQRGFRAGFAAGRADLLDALRTLTMMARTSGGVAGRDDGLVAACEQAEAAISRATGASS